MKSMSRLFLFLTVLVAFSPTLRSAEKTANDVLDAQKSFQNEAIRSQSTIDELDDQTLSLLSEYNTEAARLQSLRTYNDNLRQMLASQAREKERLNSEVEVTRREIVPLMAEMVEVLGQFINLDLPILKEERQARLSVIRDNMTRSDIALPEKFRRLFESYQIEAEYGCNHPLG